MSVSKSFLTDLFSSNKKKIQPFFAKLESVKSKTITYKTSAKDFFTGKEEEISFTRLQLTLNDGVKSYKNIYILGDKYVKTKINVSFGTFHYPYPELVNDKKNKLFRKLLKNKKDSIIEIIDYNVQYINNKIVVEIKDIRH